MKKFNFLKITKFDNYFEIWNGTNYGRYDLKGNLIECNIGFTEEAIRYALTKINKG
tara:strand:+ start:691 stop:858 length:168 start_codon:yes stop_codon:yes gene_type:complete